MSQTDTRPGFRLPWTGERTEAEGSTDGSEGAVAETGATEADESATTDAEASGDGSEGATGMTDPTVTEEPGTTDMTDATAAATGRRPTKFMADLSKAMQTAAEASRDETMSRFAADTKVAVEDIRAKSAEEAAALRRQADDDVAAVREWSKTEIARIREETDTRIAARKQALDGEMDEFGQVIEARVQRVNTAVGEFESEMAEFFERLLAEQDPTRIATMAQAMPDPPDLAAIAASVTEVVAPEPASESATEASYGEAATEPATESAEAGEAGEAGETTEATAETVTTDEAPADVEGEPTTDAPSGEATQVAEGEAAQYGEAETTNDAAEGESQQDAPAEAVATEPIEGGEQTEASEQTDQSELPAPDFAAAEAEAAAMSNGLDADDGLSMLAAARLDALTETPGVEGADRSSGTDRLTTRVVVRGLVSVASIATFKRTLGRVQGVAAIGVASGPDGEFVFTVSHDNNLNLTEAITGLPGFDAKIASETPGNIEVSAHDPDTGD
jgi:hypothetical protein